MTWTCKRRGTTRVSSPQRTSLWASSIARIRVVPWLKMMSSWKEKPAYYLILELLQWISVETGGRIRTRFRPEVEFNVGTFGESVLKDLLPRRSCWSSCSCFQSLGSPPLFHWMCLKRELGAWMVLDLWELTSVHQIEYDQDQACRQEDFLRASCKQHLHAILCEGLVRKFWGGRAECYIEIFEAMGFQL